MYQITCLENSKIYVGSAANIRKRWKLHRNHLRMGISHNKPMQHAWTKHGEATFTFCVLEFCDAGSLIEIEQKWLDSTRAFVREVGFNILTTAYSSIGLKHTAETKAKLSEIASARDHTRLRDLNEARKGLPGHNLGKPGKPWTDEQRERASLQRKGQKAWNKGVPHTEEVKSKISESCVGINRKVTDMQRAEIKRLRSEGMTYSKISLAVVVSLSNCAKIYHNNTGKYIPIGGLRTFEKVKSVAS